MSEKKTILVDGANVAYTDKGDEGQPQVKNILMVIDILKALRYEPQVIVDASFRYEVDKQNMLEHLFDEGVIRQAPAETDADYFIVRLAKEADAKIVSNDQYEEYREAFPSIEERRVPLMIVNGVVTFHKLEPASARTD